MGAPKSQLEKKIYVYVLEKGAEGTKKKGYGIVAVISV